MVMLLSSQLDALEKVWLDFMHTLAPEIRHDAFLIIGSEDPLARTNPDQHDVVKRLIVDVENTLHRYHRDFVKAPRGTETDPVPLETTQEFHARCGEHARKREDLAQWRSQYVHDGLEERSSLLVSPALEVTRGLHAKRTVNDTPRTDLVKFRKKYHRVLKMFGHYLDHAEHETESLHLELQFYASKKNRVELPGEPGVSGRLDHQKFFMDLMEKCDRDLEKCRGLKADYRYLAEMDV